MRQISSMPKVLNVFNMTKEEEFIQKQSLRNKENEAKIKFLLGLNNKNQVISKENENITDNYFCIFESCDKNFKTYCRWKIHYFSHVSKFFSLFISLKINFSDFYRQILDLFSV